MAEMTEKVRRRRAQLFALLGSDNVHERRSRTKLDEILRKNRKTWNDLVELLQTKSSDAGWFVDDDEQTEATNRSRKFRVRSRRIRPPGICST